MPSAVAGSLLFASSYSPLFVILVVQSDFQPLSLSIALILVAAVSVLALAVFVSSAKRHEPHYVTANEVTPRGSESVSYIVTYLIPFLGVDLADTSDLVSLFVLVVVIGVLYLHSNLIYMNPILNVFGYHLFEVTSDARKPSMLLARRPYVRPGDRLYVVSLGDYVLLERIDAASR